MTEKRRIDRRGFLRASAAGAAVLGAGALGAPSLEKAPGSNERVNIGVIGCGGRGMGHINELVSRSRRHARTKDPSDNVAVVAVSDIYEPRKQAAKNASGGEVYHDYRKLLERGDLHAVVIASPDHWHARMALDAMKAGKDVYLEKPMTRTAQEAKEVYHCATDDERILQVGTQHTEDGRHWRAKEAIAQGLIGKVVWSQISYSRNSKEGEWNWPVDPNASRGNLDWEEFIGPAPKRPFDPERFFRFRKYWDYSGGIATDLHYHKLAPMLIAVGADFPRRVTSGGGVWVQKDREVPDTLLTIIDFPSEHTILIASSMANAAGLEDFIRGHEANLFFEEGIVIRPEDPFRNDFRRKHRMDEIRLEPVPRDDHMTNFIKCVRSRRAEDLNCGPLLGYQTMVSIALSVEAYRENKVLFWDKEKEEVVASLPGERGTATG